MKPHDLKSMSVEELWSLHELVVSVLASKISAEKARLEQRLRELGQSTADSAKKVSHARRPYPQVFPKYRNPTRPSETWAGRGNSLADHFFIFKAAPSKVVTMACISPSLVM